MWTKEQIEEVVLGELNKCPRDGSRPPLYGTPYLADVGEEYIQKVLWQITIDISEELPSSLFALFMTGMEIGVILVALHGLPEEVKERAIRYVNSLVPMGTDGEELTNG